MIDRFIRFVHDLFRPKFHARELLLDALECIRLQRIEQVVDRVPFGVGPHWKKVLQNATEGWKPPASWSDDAQANVSR